MLDRSSCAEAKARLLPNIGTNILYLTLAAGVGIWQIPYLIRHLGVPVYGQIGVLQAIVNYASLLTFAVTWTVCRYVALHLGKRDHEGANVYFNTAFFSLVLLCAVLLAAAFALRTVVPAWIGTPSGFECDIGWLLVLFVATSCATSLSSPFVSVPFAQHRFDVINVVKALGMAIQVVVLVSCFNLLTTRVIYYGWALLIKESVVLLASAWLAFRLLPSLALDLGRCRRGAFRDMAGMSFWSVVDRVGYLLYFSIDLILINAVLGSEACGRYAPITQLSFLLAMFSLAVVQVFWPIAYEHIAQERIDTLIDHTHRTTRFMGLVLALPVGLLCGLAAPVLTVWLRDPAWAQFSPLLVLLIGPAIITFPLRHLFSITHGLNKVRITALITLGGGVLNLALSLILLTQTPLGMAGVAAATGLSLILRNAVVVPIYTAGILNRPRGTFITGMLPGVLSALALALISAALHATVGLATLPRLLVGGALLSAVYAAIVFVAVLSKSDRAFLLSVLIPKNSTTEPCA